VEDKELPGIDSGVPNSSVSFGTDAYNVVEWFECIDVEGKGYIDAEELAHVLRKTYNGIMSDDEIDQLDDWLSQPIQSPINCDDFCRLVSEAPRCIQEALDEACLVLPKTGNIGQKNLSN
jgi:hypothetical protein